MITLKQEEKLIDRLKELTELELQSVLEELREHIYMNSFQDMVFRALDVNEVFEANEELVEENDRLERLNDELEVEYQEAKKKAENHDLDNEENLAKKLSLMSPLDYDSLMSKVNRSKWIAMGHINITTRRR